MSSDSAFKRRRHHFDDTSNGFGGLSTSETRHDRWDRREQQEDNDGGAAISFRVRRPVPYRNGRSGAEFLEQAWARYDNRNTDLPMQPYLQTRDVGGAIIPGLRALLPPPPKSVDRVTFDEAASSSESESEDEETRRERDVDSLVAIDEFTSAIGTDNFVEALETVARRTEDTEESMPAQLLIWALMLHVDAGQMAKDYSSGGITRERAREVLEKLPARFESFVGIADSLVYCAEPTAISFGLSSLDAYVYVAYYVSRAAQDTGLVRRTILRIMDAKRTLLAIQEQCRRP